MADIQRVDKFICSQKNAVSRKDIKDLAKRGLITVNGKTVKDTGFKINPETDEVLVSGEKIEYKKYIYIMLNKPKGVVCSTRDGVSKTVLEILPESFKRPGLFPAGRLDKDTEGFVLITDDGDLAHKMLSPKNHVPKRYYVELRDEIEENYEREFENGMELSDGTPCKPAKFERIDGEAKACYVTLSEGMFHQVKRMFEKLGNEVKYLKRVRIGNLDLDENLKLGECLEIIDKNIAKLTCQIVE